MMCRACCTLSFGLPISSEAARYDVYQIKPHAPTEVFINHVAPTSELGGEVVKSGGAEQWLVPHRGLYAAPTYVKSLDNVMLQSERSVGAGLTPGIANRTLGAAGMAAVAYDATTTVQRASELTHAGNPVGAQSEVLHFTSRNVGMLAGAELGAATGAALGVESGPGLLVTGAIGDVAGAIGGEKVATAIDNYRIYNQDDKAGNTWQLDPKQPAQGWTRTVSTNEIDPDGVPDVMTGVPAFKTRTFTADATLTNELNYKASNTAVQLAMAHAGSPKDPYTQPAQAGDAHSMRNAAWTRDPQTHGWSRHVVDQVLEHGLVSAHNETAHPARAAQLDQAAEKTVADNLASSPRGIAQRYEAAYQQYGWHQQGPVPEAVSHAITDQRLPASDGHVYTPEKDGQWHTPGMLFGTNPATGNLRDELNATQRAEHVSPSTPSPNPQAAPVHAQPAAPEALRMDHPDHPAHALFQQARTAVHRLDKEHGRTPDQLSENLAGALTAAAKGEGMKRIDEVALSDDRNRIFAAQGAPGAYTQIAHAEVVQAVNTPLEKSTEVYQQAAQSQAQAQAQQQLQQLQQVQQAQAAPALQR